MMRLCNGTDPNLIMFVLNETGERFDPPMNFSRKAMHEKPCDCGLRFDDVSRLVIWPHHRF